MLSRIWESHGGRIVGVAAGIFLGFLYLVVGFWDMLFFALLMYIGYTLGKQRDLKLGSLFPWRRIGEWVTDRWGKLR